MKTWRKMWLALALVLLMAVPALADGPEGDVVIFGDNYTLKEDQEINGQLLVYGGNVELEEGSQVNGDVTVFGGNLTIYGEVDGDVTVWGGNVKIMSDAVVRGDVVSIGGNVTREEGADIRGEEMHGWPVVPPKVPLPPKTPQLPRIPEVRSHRSSSGGFFSGIGNLFRTLFGIVVMTVLGILVVAFLPQHTEVVAETMVKVPVQSVVSGIATFVAVPVVAVVLLITVCLLPVSAVLVLVAGVGLLFGWIAAGLLLGTKLLRATNKSEPNRVTAVAVGLPLLSVLSFVPCVGWAIWLVTVTWSLGAVVYSFFGTRSYNEPAPRLWNRSSSAGQPKDYDPRMDRL